MNNASQCGSVEFESIRNDFVTQTDRCQTVMFLSDFMLLSVTYWNLLAYIVMLDRFNYLFIF